jgi:YidC/Oxa1 family membrane protein insertase
MLMLLMMIPWLIMVFYMNKQQKTLAEQQKLQQSLPEPVVAELDTTKQVDDQVRDLEALIARDPKSEQTQRYRLMIAVAHEQNGFYDKACEDYQKFAADFRNSPYSAHAAFHAGRLARDRLHDEKLFTKCLSRLGYEVNKAVWDPKAEGDPNAKFPAAEIAARELDPVYQKGVLYKCLDGLVRIFGPEQHPEYAYAGGLILLGLLARLLLWPLTAWGYKAGKVMGAKMKVIQPQVAELKEKYKDDQMKVMQKQQQLMRQYGVSMKSGCMSSVLQMAVLIPVYQAVRHYGYPLGHGSFLWIPTLQKPDIYLLVCYTVSFILSMKLQPQQPTADPQQQQTQKMMTYLMPVMFFFMMRTVPSAFILYWTIFLFFSTFQTLWFARRWQAQGGDQAIIDALPPELRPKPVRTTPRRDAPPAGKTSPATSARAKSPAPDSVVERLGEEIPIEGAGGSKPESFFSRLFAPMASSRPAEGTVEEEPETPAPSAPGTRVKPESGNGKSKPTVRTKSGSKR